MFPERWRAPGGVGCLPGGALPRMGLWAGGDRQEDGRGVEGSEGTGTEGVLLMASSTSDFWWEVLKTPS